MWMQLERMQSFAKGPGRVNQLIVFDYSEEWAGLAAIWVTAARAPSWSATATLAENLT